MQTITFNKIALGFFAVLLALGFFVSAAETTYAGHSDQTAKTRVKAEGSASTTSSMSTSTVKTRTEGNSIDTACMVSVVTKREAALKKAWGDLSESIAEALTKRSDNLVAAWSKTDSKERQTAIKTARATWKESKDNAQKAFKDARKTAWDSFSSTAKAECKVTIPKEEKLEKSASDSIAM